MVTGFFIWIRPLPEQCAGAGFASGKIGPPGTPFGAR